jgi:hypothetical protein
MNYLSNNSSKSFTSEEVNEADFTNNIEKESETKIRIMNCSPVRKNSFVRKNSDSNDSERTKNFKSSFVN